jgi:CBS domain containing-hemolysin-like protein
MMVGLLLIGSLVTLVGAAYEVSLLSVSRAQLAQAVSLRLRGGAEPLRWPAEAARELQAASTTTSIGVVILGGALTKVFGGSSGWELLASMALLAVPLTVVSGYLLPRWLGRLRAERAVAALRPVVRPWAAFLRFVLPAPSTTAADVRALGREGAAVLPEADVEMTAVGGVLTFAQRPVREVMTPRTDMVAVAEGTPLEDIARTFAESGYSRIPVYRQTLDEIVGMLHAFDLFTLRPGAPLAIRPVTLTPASRSCGDLLLDMQRERRHLAVVLDEFGGTLGIATLEDLLSALVGEIFDEGESPAAEARGEPPLLEGDGTLPVEAVEARFGVTLPAGRAGTIAGRLAELAGRIPVTGERLLLRGLEFDVLEASPTRVERLVIRWQAPTPTPVVESGR